MDEDENSENEYYLPCVRDYRSVNNPAAIKEWFVATQPDGKLPKHTTILHITKVEAILNSFVNRLRTDIVKNSRQGWKQGTPLPGKKSKSQPLADA